MKLIEHYKFIHLDINVLLINSMAFFLEKSKVMGSIHCKAILTKSEKQVINGLKSIILDCKVKEFEVTTVFSDVAFNPMIYWNSNSNTLDLPCTPSAHKAHQQSFELHSQ